MAIRFVRPSTPGGATQVVAVADCYRNLNLLAHAQLTETDLGSTCGGHGICGGDRIRPKCPADHLSPITDAEREHLSDEELKAGWRLGCQTYPQRDGLEFEVEIKRGQF